MLKYVLDTNACSRLISGRDAAKLIVKARSASHGSVGIPAVVRFELIYGLFHGPEPTRRLPGVMGFLSLYPTVGFGEAEAEQAGRLRAQLVSSGNSLGPYDILIAGTALANGLIVVTNNLREFARVPGLTVEDWQSAN